MGTYQYHVAGKQPQDTDIMIPRRVGTLITRLGSDNDDSKRFYIYIEIQTNQSPEPVGSKI
ncbi:MAG: hypothetical protein CMP47_00505 [Rickettsiales bacterium]|nr:hypothetical protein [Rickettsiales bacterium]